MSTEKPGPTFWRHVDELNVIAKRYSRLTDPWSTAEDIRKQLTHRQWKYDIRDGRIIWLSTKLINTGDVKELVDITVNKQRCIHINTATHGDEKGNIVTRKEDEDYYTECTKVKKQVFVRNHKSDKVSMHFVTSYSPPFYPEYDVVDAWCYSENQFEKHLNVAEYIAEINDGKKEIPSRGAIRHVGDLNVDVLRVEELREYLDVGEKAIKVGVEFRFDDLMIQKLRKYCAGGGRPVERFGEALQSRGTSISLLQTICKAEGALWKAEAVMKRIAENYKHPKTMSDVYQKDIDDLCNCLEANNRNPVQKNWRYVAEKLDWEPKVIDAISTTVRDKDTYSPTVGLISMLSESGTTVNEFVKALEDICRSDRTYTKAVTFVKKKKASLDEKEEARRRKEEEEKKAEEEARRRNEEEEKKAGEETRRRKHNNQKKADFGGTSQRKRSRAKETEKKVNDDDKGRTLNVKRICIAILIVAVILGLYINYINNA